MTTVEVTIFKATGKMNQQHRFKTSTVVYDTKLLIAEAKNRIENCADADFTLKAFEGDALNYCLVKCDKL